ncbi:MAG TPA: hypothetical protein VGG34_11085 [Opitutaceae bacterium]
MRAVLFLACGAAFISGPEARAEDFVAVSSQASNGYVRARLADGTCEPETYTFKKGGFLSSRMADDSIDRMTFASITGEIGVSLAARQYLPAVDPKAARLLIVVYWGTSRAPGEFSSHTVVGENAASDTPAMGRHQNGYVPFWQGATAGEAQAFGDNMINEEDAAMLGYGSASDPDLGEYRYFVVLLAYDMQAFLRDGKARLLWQTRFSSRERRNQFDRQLRAMALGASPYFGRDSHGLLHRPVPEGRVEIGEAKAVEGRPGPGASAALAPDGTHVAYLEKRGDGLELAIAGLDTREVHLAGPVPESDGKPVRLAWLDADRVAVRLPSSELLAFDSRGNRIDVDPRIAGPVFDLPRALMGGKADSEARAAAEGKFPHRRVVVLGSDASRSRYLLLATDGAGTGRYFVYDRPTDLLYGIGKSVSTQ